MSEPVSHTGARAIGAKKLQFYTLDNDVDVEMCRLYADTYTIQIQHVIISVSTHTKR